MFKHAAKTFILQHGQSDCGAACLASIIQFHGGIQSIERIREMSGTSAEGVSLLGLLQAAEKLGFDTEGLLAESVDNLNDLSNPAILHVTLENSLSHFVVFYGFQSNKAIIGDPAKGIVTYSKDELKAIWKTKTLLSLVPNPHFIEKKRINADKIKWLIDLVRDDLPLLLIALFLGVLISVLSLASAIFSQRLIDQILPSTNTQKLVVALSLFLLILFLRSSITYLRGFFVIKQSRNFNERIISRFYHRLLRLPKYFFDTRKIGELMARMNDTRRIQDVITFIAGNIIIDSLVLVISLGFLFTYSHSFGQVLLLSTLLFGLLIRKFHGKIIVSQNEVMHSYALSESFYVDAIQGIATIKVNNKENFFDVLNMQWYSNFQKRIFKLGHLHNQFNFLAEVLGSGFIIVVFGLASFMVLGKSLSLGEMIAILSIASGLVPCLNRLVLANVQIQEARVAFDRMYEFAAVIPEEIQGDGPDIFDTGNFDLKVENLAFRFPGQKLLLSGVSFSLRNKEIVALLGESGSGKSTLLQILQKFYDYESGSVLINGRPLTGISSIAWRDVLGVVPQDVKIFNGSLTYNIALSNDEGHLDGVLKFCRELGFDTYFEKLPQYYFTLLGEDGINLSGGQKQLVALARALYKKPKLLILDEATSAMDRHTEKFILDLVYKLKTEICILWVTHKIESARLADRIYSLQDGVIRTI
ncbi:MAG TPA: peptidase domain-containing ABC transporter [Chryseolinea sp.]